MTGGWFLGRAETIDAMNHRFLILASLSLFSTAITRAADTLKHSIPAPLLGVQQQAHLGSSVAVDGIYAVAGEPDDDTAGTDSGAVKIFDTTTGALLFVLNNPSPANFDNFGFAVAISGTRVVVGAYRDDTGVPDAGSAYVYNLAGPTPTVPVLVLNNPTPASGDYFGLSVAISGLRVAVGTPFDGTAASNSGAVYVYNLASGTPTVPTAILTNPDAGFDARFGSSVALSGQRLVVGAPNDNTGAVDAGSAYAYDLLGATPTIPVAVLRNPAPASADNFGTSVGISGTRVIVSADLDDTGALSAGTVYAYDIGTATPTVPTHTLDNPSPAATDVFGRSVAISGTLVLVGVKGDDTGATDAGSAYVFDLAGVTPAVPVHTISNPTPAFDDDFGAATGISGTRVIIGAPNDHTAATNAGSAYLYDFSSGTPTVPTATLNQPGPSAGDRFGGAVAVSGNRLVVGADLLNASPLPVHVYDLSSATPTVPAQSLTNPGSSNNEFGTSVAISGTWVAVGAYEENSSKGVVYVYDVASVTPTTPVFILSNPTAAAARFGWAVSLSGTRLAVGAPNETIGTGRAYVYDLAGTTPTTPVATLNNPAPTYNSFGSSISISGTRVVMGAPADATGASGAGSAYVFDIASVTPTTPIATLNNPSPAPNDSFGESVSISGTRVAVGAGSDDLGAINAGSVHVYDVAGPAPGSPILVLPNPDPDADDRFGLSVSISGTLVFAGAHRDDSSASDAGTAYAFSLTRATPTVPLQIYNKPGAVINDYFGYTVAADGTTLAVGAILDDTEVADKGHVYVFGPATTFTQTPTLSAPVSSHVLSSGALTVSFTLPEAAQPGSVKLSFQNGAVGQVLTLAASQEMSGAHSFSFTPGNPAASPEIASTAPLPDGIYTVALSYQDAVGSGAATSNAATGVVIDPTSPTVTPPVGGFTPLTLIGPVALPDYIPQAVIAEAVGIASVTQSPAAGTMQSPGSVNVTITATDIVGHTGSTSFTVTVLTFTQDSDGDGLNDASELQMAALGFDWQTNQTALVNTLMSNANGAGLYTTSQVQALNVGTPLISKNPTTGLFKLTIGVEKSTNLQTFTPFPMTAPQTSINGAGELEFYFTVPDNAAFFQIRAE